MWAYNKIMNTNNSVKRDFYLEQLTPYIDEDLIKVLTGVRRCGKSVLLKQIINLLQERGIKSEHIVFLNFEDFEYESIKTATALYSYLKKLPVFDSSEKIYYFFDEIQHVKEFEKVIASLKATKNCSIFVTGSNSNLLSGELATLLVGRTIELRIMPFSYKEAVEYQKLKGKTVTDDFITDYIKWGGMPQRFDFEKEEDIQNYLSQVFQGIVSKDIFKKNQEITQYKFNKVSSYVMANAGKEFNAENLINYFESNNKDKIDKQSVYNYLDRMSKAFLISRVNRFNIVGKEILKTIEKHYAVDTGLRTLSTNLVNYEDTFFLENIIYNELILRGYSVYTGKTYKGEIDFVAIKGGKKCFIQVSYLMPTGEIREREFGAFRPIKDSSPKFVLSLDKLDFSKDGITHLNIIDFLLGKKDIFIS